MNNGANMNNGVFISPAPNSRKKVPHFMEMSMIIPKEKWPAIVIRLFQTKRELIIRLFHCKQLRYSYCSTFAIFLISFSHSLHLQYTQIQYDSLLANTVQCNTGADLGGGYRGCAPPSDSLRQSNIIYNLVNTLFCLVSLFCFSYIVQNSFLKKVICHQIPIQTL